LIVTLVGIVLRAWLLPALTRQWDDRQKAHELKVGVTQDIAGATADALFGGNTTYEPSQNGSVLAALAHTTPVLAAERTRAWELSSFKIESELRAYFPSSRLAADWHRYSDAVREFFIALTQPFTKRSNALEASFIRLGFTKYQASHLGDDASQVVYLDKSPQGERAISLGSPARFSRMPQKGRERASVPSAQCMRSSLITDA
jgi:hypothetical protein